MVHEKIDARTDGQTNRQNDNINVFFSEEKALKRNQQSSSEWQLCIHERQLLCIGHSTHDFVESEICEPACGIYIPGYGYGG